MDTYGKMRQIDKTKKKDRWAHGQKTDKKANRRTNLSSLKSSSSSSSSSSSLAPIDELSSWPDTSNAGSDVTGLWTKNLIEIKLEFYPHQTILSNVKQINPSSISIVLKFWHFIKVLDKGNSDHYVREVLPPPPAASLHNIIIKKIEDIERITVKCGPRGLLS